MNSTAPSDTFWWHSIDLGGGVVTPGAKSPAHLAAEWEALRLPELGGKSVLDVGTWDGYFAFEAERSGAASVRFDSRDLGATTASFKPEVTCRFRWTELR